MTQTAFSSHADPDGMLQYSRVLIEGARDLFGVTYLARLMAELSVRPDALQADGVSPEAVWSGAEACAFPAVLERVFGARGGQGLAVRMGRLIFTRVLKRFGKTYGLMDRGFRLLPAPRRMASGLAQLALIFNQQFHQHVTLEDAGTHWLWIVEDRPTCCQETAQSQGAACYVIVGILQEFMTWSSGGRFYPVRELECSGSGGARCVFCVEKKPLD